MMKDLPPEVEAAIDFIIPPLVGGVTKYGVTKRFDLLARDALCQARRLIGNTERYAPGNVGALGVAADIADANRLVEQASDALAFAVEAGEVEASVADSIIAAANDALVDLETDQFDDSIDDFRKACRKARKFSNRKQEWGHVTSRSRNILGKGGVRVGQTSPLSEIRAGNRTGARSNRSWRK
jgi:hypothetical protein